MFGIEALDVVIGMIFVYLLFSLFVSIVNEMINSWLNIRGKRLYDSIERLLGPDGVNIFYDEPAIKLITRKGSWVSSYKNLRKKDTKLRFGYRPPESIPETLFIDVISNMDITDDSILKKFMDKTSSDRNRLNEVYNSVMEEASAAYKRRLRWILLILGFFTAVIFNVNSIDIFKTLKDDPNARAKIVEQATAYIEVNKELPQKQKLTNEKIEELQDSIDILLENQINHLSSNLGIGWDLGGYEIEICFLCPVDPVFKQLIASQVSWVGFFGWVITAIAISLGAPFWFDLLSKVINIKNQVKGKKKEPAG